MRLVARKRLSSREGAVAVLLVCLLVAWGRPDSADNAIPESTRAELREALLKLVNTERGVAGLAPLDMDELACQVADRHALEMAAGNFMSHWGRDGLKPQHRYSFAGGVDAVVENVSAMDAVPTRNPADIRADLSRMHTRMYMEEPPDDGHRRNILLPNSTHAGFGVAVAGGQLRLVEIYLSRFVEITSVTRKASATENVTVEGRLLAPGQLIHSLDVVFEPLPQPRELEWLRVLRPFETPAHVDTLRPVLPPGMYYANGARGTIELLRRGRFRAPVKLPKDRAGIYTLVFWVRKQPSRAGFPVTGLCVRIG